ncbi:MAG: efflux RND transporter periplasmic adaptor subunit [Gammaproteobacteria bacterium]
MNKSKLLKGLCAGALLVLIGCGGGREDTASEKAATPSGKDRSNVAGGPERSDRSKGDGRGMGKPEVKARPVPVTTTQVARGRLDAFYSTTATLTAVEEASVVARTEGVVEAIYVEEGSMVKAGQALAQLDTERLALELARTETNLESLRRAFERAEQLYASKMISPDAFDQARFNLEREEALKALQAHDFEEATIRAPIDGFVTARKIKLGNTLQPNTIAFEIKRADTLEAILNIPEKELIKISAGQSASIRVDALEDSEFDGTLVRVAPEIDPMTGTFRATVEARNELDLLKPGMFARVEVLYDSQPDALLVAREAVLNQRTGQNVYLVRDGLAVLQPVKTGYMMGDQVEILTGLTEGDEVVVRGQSTLKDGSSVNVIVN